MTFPLKRTIQRLRPSLALGGNTFFLFARSSNHIGSQAQRAALEKQMLLEQAVEKEQRPLGLHPADHLSYQERERRETLEVVRGVNARVDAARRAALHATSAAVGTPPLAPAPPTGASTMDEGAEGSEADAWGSCRPDVGEVVSFPQFLLACKQYRVTFGSSPASVDMEATAGMGSSNAEPLERHRRRKEFVRFWNHHVGSAMLYCHQRQQMTERGHASAKNPESIVNDSTLHDFCFICFHGLSDDRLHMDLRSLQIGLRSMAHNKLTCSCSEMMAAMQYVTRELSFIEKEEHGKWTSDLQYVKRTLADLCLERIVFFFVLKAPQHSRHFSERSDDQKDGAGSGFGRSAAATPAVTAAVGEEPAKQEMFTAALGTADDALAALEVLARLHVDKEASAALVASLEDELKHFFEGKHVKNSTPPSNSTSRGKEVASTERQVSLSREFLVSELFYFIMLSARHNQFVLQQAQRRSSGGGVSPSSRRHKGIFKFTSLVQCFALLRIYLPTLWPPYAREQDRSGGKSNTTKGPLNLQRQAKLLQRISEFLANELMINDSHFVNSYHFTKIMNCLARLPGTVLCPQVQEPRGQRRAPPPQRSVPAFAGMFSEVQQQQHSTTPTADKFWQYMVSKAVIFVSSLSPKHRRLVCEQLYMCVKQKRGRHFGQVRRQTERGAAEESSRAGGSGPPTEQLPTPESVLFPLVAEMSQYKDNFDVCVKGLRGRQDQRHTKRGSSSAGRKWEEKKR